MSESRARELAAAVWPYALVLAAGLFILLPKLGAFGFWDPWEPKYGETVREMIDRDSYVVPFYRGDVRLAKPILVYWGILAGSSLFGLNEFGARIVGVGFALAALLGVYYVVAKLRGRQAGLLSAFVLATSPHFIFISRQAMPDVYLFTTVGMCLTFLCLGLYGPERRRNLHFGVSYACFALAVLAKGPVVAGAVVLGTLGLALVAAIDWPAVCARGHRLRSLGLMLAALPTALGLLVLAGVVALLTLTSAANGDPPSRADKVRERVEGLVAGWHLADALLIVLASVALGLGVALWLRGRSLLVAGLLVFAAGALATLALAEADAKIVLTSLFAMVALLATLAALAARFLKQPHLWPRVEPWIRPVARQVALFLAVFAVVAGPWHLAIIIDEGPEYFTYFIFKHNLARAADTINQSGAADFYAGILSYGLFPWSCFLLVGLVTLVLAGDREFLKKRGLESLMLIACAVTVGAFSVSVTKFAHYVAPAVIPAAIVVGLTIDHLLESRNRAMTRLAWLAAFLLFLLPAMDLLRHDGSMHLVESFTVKRFVPEDMALGGIYRGAVVAIGSLMVLSAAVRSRLLVGAIVACAVLMANHANAVFIPRLSAHKTMKNLCDTWRAEAKNGEPIGFYGDLKHGIYFYTDYAVKVLDSKEEFAEFMDPAHPAFSIIERTTMSKLDLAFREKHPGFRLDPVDRSHFQYNLVRIAPDDGRAALADEKPPSEE